MSAPWHSALKDGWYCGMGLDKSYLVVNISLRLRFDLSTVFSLPKTFKTSQSLPSILSPSIAWPFCMSEADAKKESTFSPLSEQWVRQEIKAHSNLAHGIIKVNENNVLLTEELCHATAGKEGPGEPRAIDWSWRDQTESRGRGSSCLF